jgi:hypothetical protein
MNVIISQIARKENSDLRIMFGKNDISSVNIVECVSFRYSESF